MFLNRTILNSAGKPILKVTLSDLDDGASQTLAMSENLQADDWNTPGLTFPALTIRLNINDPLNLRRVYAAV